MEYTRIPDLELYRTIVENFHDGILAMNQEGKILLVNQSMLKLSGLPREAYAGRNIRDIVESGIFQKESVTLRAIQEKQTVTDFQQYQNGRTVLVTAIPIFDGGNRLNRVLSITHDITDQIIMKKKVEEIERLSAKYYMELLSLRQHHSKRGIITANRMMKEIIDLIHHIGPTDSTVLLLGESGVGKDVLAREIHETSKRKDSGAFIKVNCGAIPKDLLESEFFGYDTGAFTGAKKDGKPGLFELADQGTLFLDEIGEFPLYLQAKLLSVLQDQQFTRVGGTKVIQVNVRIVAATNRDLESMVLRGEFREDLYYRLNVIPIQTPALRERKDDIPLLIGHFLQNFNEEYNKNKSFTMDAMDILCAYHWPGNIRELSNITERLVLTTKNDVIEPKDLPIAKQHTGVSLSKLLRNEDTKSNLFKSVEKNLIESMIQREGSIRKAAKVLGVSHTTLIRKMKKHGL
ncbi:transcriptional regulator [Bacillus sp. BA3]|uniref:sigma-54 interaction domain-containing protein n=1 Tax=Bacillaceae TaxID=186817 RepID=UPI000C33901A|nr:MULTISPECIES: sigma 54-interacting transcriptional regulator [Bacillaceae]MCT4478110.1 sigma 54-interacting transcriptional regulator [Peribacillus frigoritolerans]PKF86649.1 transcriptional regulator [Bacillus sp. BA3]